MSAKLFKEKVSTVIQVNIIASYFKLLLRRSLFTLHLRDWASSSMAGIYPSRPSPGIYELRSNRDSRYGDVSSSSGEVEDLPNGVHG